MKSKEKRHVEKEKRKFVCKKGLEPGVSAGYHRKQPGLNSRRKEQAMQERPPHTNKDIGKKDY